MANLAEGLNLSCANQSGIWKAKRKMCSGIQAALNSDLAEVEALCLQFDGKRITKHRKCYEMIVVCAAVPDKSFNIALKLLPDGKAETIANCLIQAIDFYGLEHKIKCIICDTTSVNIGLFLLIEGF